MAHRRTLAAVATTLAWLVVAGCTPTPAPAPSTPAGLTVSPVAPSKHATAAPSVSLPPVPSLPAGQHFVATAAHAVKFAVPDAWAMFDLSTFADPGVRAALEPIAKKLGLSVDEYVRQLTMQNDAIVTGPDRGAFTPTISVRKEAAEWSDEVPSVADEQQLVAGVSGTVTSVDRLVTPVGLGYAVRYTKPSDADANVTLHCAKLALPSTRNTLFLTTVETDTAAERDALVAGIAATLQPA